MVKKGYRQTKEQKKKNSIVHKGKHASLKTEFKKGHRPWNKGGAFSIKSKIRMSKTWKIKYASGYIHPMKGKQRSEESNVKNSESQKKLYANGYIHPMKGKHHTIKSRKKISVSKRGKKYPVELYPNHGMRNKNSNKNGKTYLEMYGKNKSDKIKMESSNSHKKLFAFGYIHPMQGRHHTIEARQKIIDKRRFQVIPVEDTSIEVKLQDGLKNKNIVFSTHKPIFGLPDIFIEPNLCIFADGDYWHKYPNRTEHDKYVNEVLEKHGYKILRFWEREINNDIESCINKILKICYTKMEVKA